MLFLLFLLPLRLTALSSISSPSTCHRTFALFKPDGFLSQFVNNGQLKKRQRLVGELFDSTYPLPGLMTIGRLDEMSEGLLLVTTDGFLSHCVNRGGVEKEYYAQLDGALTTEAVRDLERGVAISKQSGGGGTPFHTAPCRVVVLEDHPDLPPRRRNIRDARHGPTTWVSITIREGKNRQVRRMTAAVGFPTLRLVRVRVGSVRLLASAADRPLREQLRPGGIRELGEEEISMLYDLSKIKNTNDGGFGVGEIA